MTTSAQAGSHGIAVLVESFIKTFEAVSLYPGRLGWRLAGLWGWAWLGLAGELDTRSSHALDAFRGLRIFEDIEKRVSQG